MNFRTFLEIFCLLSDIEKYYLNLKDVKRLLRCANFTKVANNWLSNNTPLLVFMTFYKTSLFVPFVKKKKKNEILKTNLSRILITKFSCGLTPNG